MIARNQCLFWDCNETIPPNHFLCSSHYAGRKAGVINQCPKCGKYKDAENDDDCPNCYRQRASAWLSQVSGTRSPNKPARAVYTTDRNECRFWSCAAIIRAGHYLCLDHFIQARQSRIDQCPNCVSYKAVRFPQCYNCHQPAEVQEGNAPTDESDDNHSTTEFFVYVLTLDGGAYYVGHTNHLHARLQEHRYNMSQETKGKNPKLVWFTTVSTRPEAAGLEQELKELNANARTRREIHKMVAGFRQLVDELDHTPPGPEVANAVRERRLPYGGGMISYRRQR